MPHLPTFIQRRMMPVMPRRDSREFADLQATPWRFWRCQCATTKTWHSTPSLPSPLMPIKWQTTHHIAFCWHDINTLHAPLLHCCRMQLQSSAQQAFCFNKHTNLWNAGGGMKRGLYVNIYILFMFLVYCYLFPPPPLSLLLSTFTTG